MRSAVGAIVASLITYPLFAQLLITNTTVVDVENKTLLPSMYVLIEKGIITNISKQMNVSDKVQVIDGSGKFLIPGFADAHVHFFQSGGAFARPDIVDLRKFRPYKEEINWTQQNMESQLRRYASLGITTVVDVGSTINFLKQRDTFRSKNYVPSIYMAGPLFVTVKSPIYEGLRDDDPFHLITNLEEIKTNLKRQLPYKPDFIKIGYIVPGRNKDSAARHYFPMVKMVVEEAHKLGMRVAVHAFEKLTAQLAVEAGADHLVHTPVDVLLDKEFIELIKKRNVSISSSASVFEGYYRTFMQTYVPSSFDLHYADPFHLQSILTLKNLPDTAMTAGLRDRFTQNEPKAKKDMENLKNNLKMLADAGTILVTATDAGNIGTLHGSSYFKELEVMQQSGLDLWQLLQACTINVATAMQKQNEFGSVSKGKRADMLLLSANPLDGLSNWNRIDQVIIKGVAWKPEQLLPIGSR